MTLEVYHTLFIVFLVITIILFVLLIIFFFVFDIRKIISIKTGWAVKQSVKELDKINQKEDNAKRKKYKANSGSLYKKQNEDVPITAKLEQVTKETVPLKVITESQRIQNKPDMEDKHKKEGIFDIIETKIVMFSDEIITKKQTKTEM